ncbi:hypothetical protein EJ110_NYTH12370 [Nymphaea thermarum]|nr:hypothetical protein EJ110_NYTH12370 [Nymphaea thermarum]
MCLPTPGKAVAGGKSDVRDVQKKGLKARRALADLPKPGKTSFTGPKVPALKQKSAVPVKNSNGAPKNGQLTEEEIKQCNEWAKEGIEHIHFSGNDMHKFEKETRECNVEREVNGIMAGFHNWIQISHVLITFGQMEQDVERYDKDNLEFERTPERLWSPREQPEHDVSSFLRGDEDTSNSFMDDKHYCIPEFKLKRQYEVETA